MTRRPSAARPAADIAADLLRAPGRRSARRRPDPAAPSPPPLRDRAGRRGAPPPVHRRPRPGMLGAWPPAPPAPIVLLLGSDGLTASRHSGTRSPTRSCATRRDCTPAASPSRPASAAPTRCARSPRASRWPATASPATARGRRAGGAARGDARRRRRRRRAPRGPRAMRRHRRARPPRWRATSPTRRARTSRRWTSRAPRAPWRGAACGCASTTAAPSPACAWAPSSASAGQRPAALLHRARLSARRAPRRRVALVGKGITFDSGGLSLKTADSMQAQKRDMAGAAVVLGGDVGAAGAAPADRGARLRRQRREHAERHAPSGPATCCAPATARPSRCSTPTPRAAWCSPTRWPTRRRQRPDCIIDFATLTAAVRTALGPRCAAVLGTDRAPDRRAHRVAPPTPTRCSGSCR